MAKKNEKKRSKLGVILNIIIITIILGGLIGAGAVFYIVKNIVDEAPVIDPTRFAELWTENAELLDVNGELIEKLQIGGYRTVIKYDEMSSYLVDAYVAVEDKTFWEHSGFNYIRLLGAVWDSVTSDSRISGTSTITQQAARNLYLTDTMTERSLDRKVKEAYYTILMERHLSKEQILESYLNTIYLGSGANGVQAAAEIYFSKNASDLDIIESAILAGIPKSPTAYSPMKTLLKKDVTEDNIIIDDTDSTYTIVFNESSHDRYLTVIRVLHENGVLSDSDYETAQAVNIYEKIHPGKVKDTEISSYFSDMVKTDVINDLMDAFDYTQEEATQYLYNNGFKIYSTMDLRLQKIVETIYNQKDFSDYFGDSTVSSVRNFQSRYAIQVDGVVGPGTWSKLLELGAVTEENIPDQMLRKGMTDPSIVILKEALNKMGLFNNYEDFPRVTVFMDNNKNIISEDRNIVLYKYQNMVDENQNLVVPKDEYKIDTNGNIILLKNNRFFFASRFDENNNLSNIDVYIKNTFTYDEEDQSITTNSGRTESLSLEQIEAGVVANNKMASYNLPSIFIYTGRDVRIPHEYKSFDENKNLVISKDFIESSDFLSINDNGDLLIHQGNYSIDEKGIIQPQSAFVLTDYTTGELRAMVGGRNITGQKIYNRAVEPRQPGSSIKPLAVYLPAIDSRRWTAGTVVDDIPTYLGTDPSVRWPLNWYETGTLNQSTPKYWGLMTVRDGIEQSLNVVSAIIANDIGPLNSIEYLKDMGITSVVESGRINDVNLSAMALGGMSDGISPIQMTEAYGTIANGGVHTETITYAKVLDSKGNIVLEKNPEKNKVVDSQVAYIVQDMMRTGVTRGLSSSAAISPNNSGITVAGKTGTTSNKYDAWFVGYTPYYAGAVWFGNDINVPMDQGSKVAALFWSRLMSALHEGLPDANFIRPDGILDVKIDNQSGKLPTELSYLDPRGSTVVTELFLPGTQPTSFDDVHIIAKIDTETNQLANENCPPAQVVEKVFIQRQVPYIPENHLDRNLNPIIIRDQEYVLPTVVCQLHTFNIYNIMDDEFVNSPKFTIFPDGTVYVKEPIYITLTDGNKLLLPFASRINKDLSIQLINGTIIKQDQYYIDSIDKPDYVIPVEEPAIDETETIPEN
ncbi:MAG: transglycosylase domain-containing protein [Clostridiales bacterium]|nr:transglycosylase domain-containing protein [Clostridiales bacterium]